MKNLFAMTVPILPGKTEQWKKFRDEINGKYLNEFAESRRKLNIHERTFFQTTPKGDFVIVTLEGENPASAFKSFGTGSDSFTQWFTKEVKEIHGIDLKNPAQEPMPQLSIDSRSAVLQN